MSKGFVAGVLVGTVVSAVGAGALSVAMGPPERMPPVMGLDSAPVPPTAPEPDAGGAPEPDAAELPAPTDEPDPEEAAGEPAAVQVAEPETAPEAEPAPMPVAVTEAAPEAPLDDTPPDAETELDVTLAPGSPGAAPSGATGPSSERPATTVPSAPEQAGSEDAPEIAARAPEPPLPARLPEQIAPEETPEVSTPPESPAETPEDTPEGIAEEVQPEILPQTPPQPESAEGSGPAIGTPAASLIGRDGGRISGRLPSVGGDEAQASPAPDAVQPGEAPPLERFAAESEAAPDAPRMAIVLIDDGTGPLGPDTVGEFPFPVSFAISASHPDAAGVARAYRAQGFEVLAVADAPEGAQASDVEIALEGALDAVPEAIGVIEGAAGGLQSSRGVSDQVASYIRASGHGLVMLPKGLNTAQTLALREGVPSATVFRDFDGEGQAPRVMRRFLDQAAFRARQEGAVVMLGRLRADTVSALLLWGLQDRANSIALVPVSTVLRESVAPPASPE